LESNARLERSVDALQKELSDKAQEVEGLVSDCNAGSSSAQLDIGRLQSELQRALQDLQLKVEQSERCAQVIRDLESRVAELDLASETLGTEFACAAEKLTEAQELSRALSIRVSELQEVYSDAKEQLEAEEKSHAAQTVTLREELAAAQTSVQTMEEEKSSWEQAHRREKRVLEAQVEEIERLYTESLVLRDAATRELSAAKSRLQAAQKAAETQRATDEERIVSLEAHISTLRSDLEASHSVTSEEDTLAEISRLNSALKLCESQREELQNILQRRDSDAIQSIQAMRDRAILTRQLSEREELLREAQAENSRLHAELEFTEKAMRDSAKLLQNRSTQFDTQLIEAKRDRDELAEVHQGSLDELQKRCAVIEQLETRLQQAHQAQTTAEQSWRSEAAQLETQIADKAAALLASNGVVQSLESEVRVLREGSRLLEAAQGKLRAEKAELDALLSHCKVQQQSSAHANLQSTLRCDELASMVDRMSAEKLEVEEQLQECAQRLQKFGIANSDLTRKCTELEAEAKAVEANFKRKCMELDAQNAAHLLLQKDVLDLTQRCTEVETGAKAVQANLNRKCMELEAQNAANLQLQKDASHRRSELGAKQSSLETLQQEVGLLRSAVQEKDSSLHQAHSEKDASNSSLHATQEALQAAKAALQERDHMLQHLSGERDAALAAEQGERGKVAQRDRDITRLISSLSSTEKEMKELQATLEQQQRNLEAAATARNDAVIKYDDLLQTMMTIRAGADQEIAKLKLALEDANRTTQHRASDCEAMLLSREAAEKALANSLAALKEKDSELQQVRCERDDVLANYEQAVQVRSKSEYANMAASLVSLQKELSKAQALLREKDAALQKLSDSRPVQATVDKQLQTTAAGSVSDIPSDELQQALEREREMSAENRKLRQKAVIAEERLAALLAKAEKVSNENAKLTLRLVELERLLRCSPGSSRDGSRPPSFNEASVADGERLLAQLRSEAAQQHAKAAERNERAAAAVAQLSAEKQSLLMAHAEEARKSQPDLGRAD
jgi:chromosome segregation ATPase